MKNRANPEAKHRLHKQTRKGASSLPAGPKEGYDHLLFRPLYVPLKHLTSAALQPVRNSCSNPASTQTFLNADLTLCGTEGVPDAFVGSWLQVGVAALWAEGVWGAVVRLWDFRAYGGNPQTPRASSAPESSWARGSGPGALIISTRLWRVSGYNCRGTVRKDGLSAC